MTLRSIANRRLALAAGSVLSTLIYAVDATIINVALPNMRGSLQASQDQIAWVLTSYIVVSAIATPPAAWFAARFGLRRVLSVSIIGFTAGSVLCGLSTSLEELVLFRMMQGAFGAALAPLSQVALLQEYPREKHGRVMALWSIGVMVGPIIGPTLGGFLTDALSWHWTFFINLPIGILAWLGIVEGMPAEHADHSRPFDWVGFLLLSMALALFQLMIDRGQTLDWFESGEILAEAFFAAVLFCMFVVHIVTARHPFIDPGLFRDRNFSASVALMFIIGLSLLSPSVLLPSFLQSLQGYTPAQAGTLLAVRGLAAILAVMIAGWVIDRIDPRYLLASGVLAAAGSLVLLGGLSLDSPTGQVMYVGFMQGFGVPMILPPLSVVAYATLRLDQRAEGGVLLTLSRSIGSSIGISLAVAALARSTQVNQSYLVEHFTPYDYDRLQALGGAPGANAETAGLVAEIGRQAAAIAFSNTFHLIAVATLVALPFVWFMKVHRVRKLAPAALGELG